MESSSLNSFLLSKLESSNPSLELLFLNPQRVSGESHTIFADSEFHSSILVHFHDWNLKYWVRFRYANDYIGYHSLLLVGPVSFWVSVDRRRSGFVLDPHKRRTTNRSKSSVWLLNGLLVAKYRGLVKWSLFGSIQKVEWVAVIRFRNSWTAEVFESSWQKSQSFLFFQLNHSRKDELFDVPIEEKIPLGNDWTWDEVGFDSIWWIDWCVRTDGIMWVKTSEKFCHSDQSCHGDFWDENPQAQWHFSLRQDEVRFFVSKVTVAGLVGVAEFFRGRYINSQDQRLCAI
jgi:hypothetical protein